MTTTTAILVPQDETKPVVRVQVDASDYRSHANAISAEWVERVPDTWTEHRGLTMLCDEEFRLKDTTSVNRRANLLTDFDHNLGGDVLVLGTYWEDETTEPGYGYRDIPEELAQFVETVCRYSTDLRDIPTGSTIKVGGRDQTQEGRPFRWLGEWALISIAFSDAGTHPHYVLGLLDKNTKAAYQALGCGCSVNQVITEGQGPSMNKMVELLQAQGLPASTENLAVMLDDSMIEELLGE